MRRALLYCATIVLAIACGDYPTEAVPDRAPVTSPAALKSPTIAFATTTTEDGLTINTDKDDYQPGDTVHFTGSGWPANDVLDIVLTDEPLTHEPHTWSVDVGADGMFHDSTYVVDEGDLDVTFTLTASSRATGRSLTVVFTDAQPQTVTVTPITGTVNQGGSATYTVAVSVVGNNTPCPMTLSVLNAPTPLPAGAAASFSGGDVITTAANFSKTLTISTLSTTPASTTNFTVQVMRGLGCQGNGAENGSSTLFVLGPATHLAFGVQPSSAAATASITPAVTVQVRDDADHVISSTASITLAIDNNPGSGTLSGTATVLAIAGVATFPGLSIDKAGTGYTLAASSLGLVGNISSAFNITVGPAAKLAFTTQPSGGTPGVAFGTQPVVEVQDAGGNRRTANPGGNANITLAITPLTGTGGAVLACATNPLGATLGVAAFGGCRINLAGTNYRLRATASGLTLADSDPFNVAVNNQAPTVNAGGPYSGNEGSAIALSGATATDPDVADVLLYTWSSSSTKCTFSATNVLNPSITCTDNGSYTATLSVDDQHGHTATSNATVNVSNVAPTATFNAPSPVNEGTDIALSLTSPVDPSSDDVTAGFHYAFDCGSGYGTALTYATAGTGSTASCPTTDNGMRTVKGKIFDKDNGATEYMATVTINNVAPTATFNAPSPVNEGTDIALSLTSPVDPSSDDVTAGFHYAFDCGSGYGSATSYATAGTSSTKNCPTTDDATLTVKGKIFDKDGGASEYTAQVIVKNVAPIVDAGEDQTGDEGETFHLQGSFTDPGADTHTWTWEYAEGFHDAATCDITDATTSLNPTITCNDDGTVYVTLTVTDDDLGVGSDKLKLTINNVAPTATGLTTNSPVNEGSNITLSLAGVFDPSTVDAATLMYAFDCGSGYGAFGSANSATCATDDNGTRNVQGKVKDKDGGVSPDYPAVVTINNVAPTATFNSPAEVNEGSAIALSLTSPIDPSSVDVTAGFRYAFDCGDGSGYGTAISYLTSSTTSTKSCPTTDNGTRAVKGKIFDKDDGATEYTGSVTVKNVDPIATFNAPSEVNEGSAIALSLTSPFDPSSVDVTAGFHYAFDCGDGGGYGTALTYATSGTTSMKSCPTTDNGTRAVKGKIFDKDDGATEYNASVLVKNVAPLVGPITITPNVVQVTNPVSLSSPFSDVGTGDTHTGMIDWQDGAPSVATIVETSGSGTATGTHTYTAAGVYTVSLTVTDDDGGVGSATYQYVVVFDPSAGFVTGGGWIASPAGACRFAACTYDTQGKATFGFVSKYITQGKDKSLELTGNTEFQFQAGNLNFKSINYEWLVVNGGSGRAQYKGTGTVNGGGNFGFMLTAYDGSPDKFRIKIWDVSTSNVVYDNKMGQPDTSNDATVLGGGSIIIHVPKGVS